ncbi:MAG: hypothetical protein CL927_09075 [Deltaproteobacteria bacterium]|nr:hypothetical protein [Deltaproteobacteria bacterium]
MTPRLPLPIFAMLCFGIVSTACDTEEEAASSPVEASSPPDTTKPQGSKPDIVVVVVDTLRADHLSLHGYERPTSPRLDALAAQGMWFDRAYAQSGWTLASFASLLTGLYPHQHTVSRDGCLPDRFGRMAPATITLAEALKSVGYTTAAWMNNTFLAPEFGLQDGFDVYDYRGATNDVHRTGSETVAAGLAWLDSLEKDQRSFLMLHFMEPHLDYAPPADIHGTFAKGPRPTALAYPKTPNPFTLLQQGGLTLDETGIAYLKALYDEEILAADRALGELIDGLKDRRRLDNTLLVITADHGEEFWEHGKFEHGHDLWSELTRVPLVVHGPGLPKTGRIDTIVEHTDLVAGLAAAAGADMGNLPGVSFFEVAAGPKAPRVALSDNCLYGPSCVSLIDETHRLMLRHHLQMDNSADDFEAAMATATVQKVINVWALDASGYERVELSPEEQQTRGRAMARIMAARRGSLEALAATTGPAVPSYETFNLLKELGYVEREDAQAVPQTPCR